MYALPIFDKKVQAIKNMSKFKSFVKPQIAQIKNRLFKLLILFTYTGICAAR